MRSSPPTITTSAAFCRSMSMTARQVAQPLSCCGRARRRLASRCGASAPACAPDQDALASHPHHHPGRQSLCPPRGHDVLRAERPQLPLRADRHEAAHRQSSGHGGCGAHPTGGGRLRGRPWLCRDETPGQELVVRASRGCPHRGDPPGTRHPLCGYQPQGNQPTGGLREPVLCRGQAENWIKFRKAQLASDRTSCRRAVANQIRLVLHTAAYWLMLSLREAIPAARDLARAEFATLRLRLLKIAVRSMGSLVLSTGAAIAPIPSLPMRSPRSRPRRGERNAADQHARAADQTIPANSGEYDELGQLRTDGQRDTCCCDGCRCKSKLNREMTRNREMKKLLDHGSAPAIDFIIV